MKYFLIFWAWVSVGSFITNGIITDAIQVGLLRSRALYIGYVLFWPVLLAMQPFAFLLQMIFLPMKRAELQALMKRFEEPPPPLWPDDPKVDENLAPKHAESRTVKINVGDNPDCFKGYWDCNCKRPDESGES